MALDDVIELTNYHKLGHVQTERKKK